MPCFASNLFLHYFDLHCNIFQDPTICLPGTTYLEPDKLEEKRKLIDEAKKRQAEECEKQRAEKEKQRRLLKEKESEWLEAGIQTKTRLNKSLIAREKVVVSTAKGKAMSDCLISWPNGEKAGDYDKIGYMNYIKSIQDAEDEKYSIIIQINAALDASMDWLILKGMIETLL